MCTKFSCAKNFHVHQIPCAPNSHVHQIPMCTKFTCAPNSHVHKISMCTKFPCAPNSHVHQIPMCMHQIHICTKFPGIHQWPIKLNSCNGNVTKSKLSNLMLLRLRNCLSIHAIININTTAIDCLWNVTHIRHVSYGHHHVVPSATLLAGVYASPAKPSLAYV